MGPQAGGVDAPSWGRARGMATVNRTIGVPIERVFAALLEPRTYPDWLVGCQDIRKVEDAWPAVGGRFHHRVGLAGPFTVADHTEVLEVEEPFLLSLEVRARPLGRGRATFRLAPGPTTDTTEVTLDEVPIGALAPTEPLAAPLIAARNRRSLARLAELVEDRSEP